MQKTDLAELRRLWEAATKGQNWQEEVLFAEACKLSLPALLDELEAAREELQGWRHERAMTIEAFRLIQNGLDPKLIGHPNGSEFGDALRAMLDARDRRMKLIGAAEELERLARVNQHRMLDCNDLTERAAQLRREAEE